MKTISVILLVLLCGISQLAFSADRGDKHVRLQVYGADSAYDDEHKNNPKITYGRTSRFARDENSEDEEEPVVFYKGKTSTRYQVNDNGAIINKD